MEMAIALPSVAYLGSLTLELENIFVGPNLCLLFIKSNSI